MADEQRAKSLIKRNHDVNIKEQPLIYDAALQGRMSSQGGPKLVSIIGLLHRLPLRTGLLSSIHDNCHFWVNFCSTQKCVKCDEMDVASKQRKSQQDSIHCKYVMWSNFVMTSYSALQMWSNLSLIHIIIAAYDM